jgi:hypothetical protein
MNSRKLSRKSPAAAARPRIERDVKQYARRKIKAAGGDVFFVNGAGCNGVLDALVVWPYQHIHVIEFKRPRGGVLSRSQEHMIALLSQSTSPVCVLRTCEEVDYYVEFYGRLHPTPVSGTR